MDKRYLKKNILMMNLFITHRFTLHKTVSKELEFICVDCVKCGLLVDCGVFISCLNCHSDGTHSLQRIL